MSGLQWVALIFLCAVLVVATVAAINYGVVYGVLFLVIAFFGVFGPLLSSGHLRDWPWPWTRRRSNGD